VINAVKFMNRNWFRTVYNVLARHYYPHCNMVDHRHVKILETDIGKFHNSHAARVYHDLFSQVTKYRIDDLKKTDVVLDVGANVGAYTVMVAPRVKHVIAVEPLFYRELQQNVILNDINNVRCLPYALGDGSDFEINFCNETRICESMRFNEILARCPYKPNVLKIDCEGGEYAVSIDELIGCMTAIDGEFHTFDCCGNRKDPTLFVKRFKELGYKCDYRREGKQIVLSARKG
jgi:hypothetical protein